MKVGGHPFLHRSKPMPLTRNAPDSSPRSPTEGPPQVFNADLGLSTCDCAEFRNNSGQHHRLSPESPISPQAAHNLKHQSHSFAQALAPYAASSCVSMPRRAVHRTGRREQELGYVHVQAERWVSRRWQTTTALCRAATLSQKPGWIADHSGADTVFADGDDGGPRG